MSHTPSNRMTPCVRESISIVRHLEVIFRRCSFRAERTHLPRIMLSASMIAPGVAGKHQEGSACGFLLGVISVVG